MTDLHTFKIHAPLNPREAFVEMDGERMKGVRRVEFDLAANNFVELKLTVYAEVDITTEFRDEEIITAKRIDAPSAGLRVRARRSVAQAFPEMMASEVNSIGDKIARDIEGKQ